jgi:hypothetical protein
MIIKKQTKELPLTRDLAAAHAAIQPLPGERTKKDARLNFFRNHLKKGTFLSPQWHVAILPDGTEYRVDGQHTSTVLAECPSELFPQTTVNVTYWSIEDVFEDGAILFDMFDNPKSARTSEDKMCFFRAQHPDLVTQPAKHLCKVAVTVKYAADLTDSEKWAKGYTEAFKDLPDVTTRNMGEFYKDERWRKFALWSYQWHSAEYAWIYGMPISVMAVILFNWMANLDEAQVFWSEVFTGSNSDPKSASRELVMQLQGLKDANHNVKTDKCLKFSLQAWRLWHAEPRNNNTDPMAPPPQMLLSEPSQLAV